MLHETFVLMDDIIFKHRNCLLMIYILIVNTFSTQTELDYTNINLDKN